MRKVRVFEAFAGIGCQREGWGQLCEEFPGHVNFDYVGISEIDPHAIISYMAAHGKTRNFGDISEIDWSEVPDFDMFTWSFPCFVAGTLICTSRGYIPIEDVMVGDRVLTHTNTYQKVVAVGRRPGARVVRLSGFDKNIICTPNHPFYVKNAENEEPYWLEACRITPLHLVGVLHKDDACVSWRTGIEIDCLEETATVYNMEVENDNSYTANGAIVHNCTDISNAGKRGGLSKESGTRSSLAWEAIRAIKEKRPKWALMENVKALMQKKFASDFAQLRKEVEELGYVNYYAVLNSKNYGTAQNRERVFMISIRVDEDDPRPVYNFPEPFPLDKCVEDYMLPVEEIDDSYFISQDRVTKKVLSDILDQPNVRAEMEKLYHEEWKEKLGK